MAGEAAFDRAASMRNACWAIAWAIGALLSDAFRFAVALASEAAFDQAALLRNACWAIAWAIGAFTSDTFHFAPLLFAPGVGAGWPWP